MPRPSLHPSPGPASCRLALFQRDRSDYQELLRKDCVETARRYGYPVQVFSADNDSRAQVEQIRARLDDPPDKRLTVAIINPVDDLALLSTAHAAVRLGVGWVLLMRSSDYLTVLREEHSRLPVFSVAPNNVEVGRIQALQMKAILPEGGEIVYIRGPLGVSAATRRFEGMQHGMGESTAPLSTVISDWTTDGGARAMNEWLQVFNRRDFPKFVVGAQNDAMAVGARTVLEDLAQQRSDFSLKHIRLTGCDGSPEYGQRLVKEGKLTATIILPPCAGRAVHEIAAMLAGGPRPSMEVTFAPTSLPDLTLLAATWAPR